MITGLSTPVFAQKKNAAGNKQKDQSATVADRKITIEGNEVYEGSNKLATFLEQFAKDEDRTRTVMFYSPDGLRLAIITLKGADPKEMNVNFFNLKKTDVIKLNGDQDTSPPGLARFLAKHKVF